MFLYETAEGYTYVDKNFKPLMNKHFKWAGRFFEGLAVATRDGYAGYIDTQGRFAIQPQFEYALPFHHGVALVWKNGWPYLIGRNGKIRFGHNYRFIKYASRDSFEPIFIVKTPYGKCGLTDQYGKLLIDTIFRDIRPFSEGLSVVEKKDGAHGVIDRRGRFVVPFGKYKEIGSCHSSRMAVIDDKLRENNEIGYIDKTGRMVFKVAVASPWTMPAFLDGLAVIQSQDRKYNILINKYGQKIYETTDGLRLLKYGYALASKPTERHGDEGRIIDRNGAVACRGADGITLKDKKVFFTNAGAIIAGEDSTQKVSGSHHAERKKIQFKFIDPDGYRDGLLFVIFNDTIEVVRHWGYLNEQGQVVYDNLQLKNRKEASGVNITWIESGDFHSSSDAYPLQQSLRPGKITLLLDSATYSNAQSYQSGLLFHRLRIINETRDTICLNDQMDKYPYVEAKDAAGVWRDIQFPIIGDVVSSSIHYSLPPGNFWEYGVYSHAGGFRTKMRVQITVPKKLSQAWQGGEMSAYGKIFVSNEIDCQVNASQFLRSENSAKDGYPFEDYNFDRIIYMIQPSFSED